VVRPRGCRFDSCPQRFTFNLGQVVYTHASVHQAVNWYRCKLGTKQAPTRHTSPVSVDLQLRLVSGWGLLKRRSAPPNGPLWLGSDFVFFILPVSVFILNINCTVVLWNCDISLDAFFHSVIQSILSFFIICSLSVLWIVVIVLQKSKVMFVMSHPSPRPRGSAWRKTASSLILRGHF